jgi:hypothetical protein
MFFQKYFSGIAPGDLDCVLNLLHEFFENTEDRYPDRVAVQSGNAALITGFWTNLPIGWRISFDSMEQSLMRCGAPGDA